MHDNDILLAIRDGRAQEAFRAVATDPRAIGSLVARFVSSNDVEVRVLALLEASLAQTGWRRALRVEVARGGTVYSLLMAEDPANPEFHCVSAFPSGSSQVDVSDAAASLNESLQAKLALVAKVTQLAANGSVSLEDFKGMCEAARLGHQGLGSVLKIAAGDLVNVVAGDVGPSETLGRASEGKTTVQARGDIEVARARITHASASGSAYRAVVLEGPSAESVGQSLKLEVPPIASLDARARACCAFGVPVSLVLREVMSSAWRGARYEVVDIRCDGKVFLDSARHVIEKAGFSLFGDP